MSLNNQQLEEYNILCIIGKSAKNSAVDFHNAAFSNCEVRAFSHRQAAAVDQIEDAAAGGTRAAGTAALLQYGETEQYIPLDSDAVYDIDTGAYTIHLRVQDGGIAVVDSPCPDHLCEGFGVLRRTGDWAACLPARASVTIVEKGGN